MDVLIGDIATPLGDAKRKKKMGAYVERACGSPRCECGRRCCFRWRFTFKISVVSWFCSQFGPQTATFSFRSTHKSIAQIFRRRLERENADGIMNGTVCGVTGSVCRYDPGRWWVAVERASDVTGLGQGRVGQFGGGWGVPMVSGSVGRAASRALT